MAKGISIHIGINQANPSFEVATLQGCHGDAQAMFQIATDNGFEATPPFLDGMATRQNVEAAISEAAERLVAGDIFLFTFAGHGSINPTFSSPEELDSQDETILLHDCILIDNYLRLNLWSQFKAGVRILGIADSCHSGTALASAPGDIDPASPSGPITLIGGAGNVATAVSVAPAIHCREEPDPMDPPLVTQRIPQIGKYDRAFSLADKARILEVSPQIHNDMRASLKPAEPLRAKLLTLGACRDFELARDGETNGVFTKALIDVWDNGAFVGNYDDFIRTIAQRVLLTSPNQHSIRRPLVVDEDFISQRPFTIG